MPPASHLDRRNEPLDPSGLPDQYPNASGAARTARKRPFAGSQLLSGSGLQRVDSDSSGQIV